MVAEEEGHQQARHFEIRQARNQAVAEVPNLVLIDALLYLHPDLRPVQTREAVEEVEETLVGVEGAHRT